MSQTLDTFNRQKQQALALLDELAGFLHQGRELGVVLPTALASKLDKARQDIGQEKLRIALVGGFSEGKTALAAAWLERLDENTMHISQRESSNEVQRYDIGDMLELVDTPGLFGFKEQFNPDSRAIEKYRDITRQYVSEAHLVLYVMNATNPVKASHEEELQWLFRTLDLLPRTVFVLGRFDEVADLEDEEEYQEKLAIKQHSVTERLDAILALSAQERAALSIVAVAANPFGQGTAHWLQHLEQFRQLSHIGALQAATQQRITQSGGPLALAQAMRHSIVSDLLERQLPLARRSAAELLQESRQLDAMRQGQQGEIHLVQQKIAQARVRLSGKIVRYFEELILQAQGTTPDTFAEFYHREIGSEANLVRQRLKEYFVEEVSSITEDLNRIQITLESGISHFNSTATTLGKHGLHYLTGSNLINTQNILAARDGLSSIAKTMGMDIGKYLVFKSFGAVNLAKGINGMLSVLGLALEVWDTWQQEQRKRMFRAAVDKLCEQMAEESRNLVASIESESFEARFFPSLAPLQAQLREISRELDELRQRLARFEQWRQQGERIHAARLETLADAQETLPPSAAGMPATPALAPPVPPEPAPLPPAGTPPQARPEQEIPASPARKGFWKRWFD